MILAFATTASAGTITFFDGGPFTNSSTCAPGVWCGSQVASSGVTTSSFAFTNRSSGGAANDSANRGDGLNKAWEKDTHSFDSTGAAGMRFLNINAAYTFTGSFASLSYSYNLQDSGSLNVGYSIAIVQNGNVYTSSPLDVVTPNDLTWSANGVFGMTNLSASSFLLVNSDLSLGAALPAFSGTMEFGYLVANSDTTGGPRSYVSGIDNWSVTLNNAAPEPSSIALCCVGGLLYAVSRLRRRGPKSVTVRISA